MIIKRIFIFLFFTLLWVGCKKKGVPEDLCTECDYGNTCKENQCVCLTDSVTVKVGKFCMGLNNGTYTEGFYSTSGCYLTDTMTIYIPKREQPNPPPQENYRKDFFGCTTAKPDISGDYGIDLGFTNRIKRENGLDSIHFSWYPSYVVKDSACHVAFNGNFINSNTLVGKLMWLSRKTSTPMDSCNMTFKHNQNL